MEVLCQGSERPVLSLPSLPWGPSPPDPILPRTPFQPSLEPSVPALEMLQQCWSPALFLAYLLDSLPWPWSWLGTLPLPEAPWPANRIHFWPPSAAPMAEPACEGTAHPHRSYPQLLAYQPLGSSPTLATA